MPAMSFKADGEVEHVFAWGSRIHSHTGSEPTYFEIHCDPRLTRGFDRVIQLRNPIPVLFEQFFVKRQVYTNLEASLFASS